MRTLASEPDRGAERERDGRRDEGGDEIHGTSLGTAYVAGVDVPRHTVFMFGPSFTSCSNGGARAFIPHV